MTLGVNCMKTVQWYVRGYKTVEKFTSSVKVGKFSNKISPSEFNRRINCLTVDMKTESGMKAFEGTCKDPLAIASAFSQITMSPCEGNLRVTKI